MSLNSPPEISHSSSAFTLKPLSVFFNSTSSSSSTSTPSSIYLNFVPSSSNDIPSLKDLRQVSNPSIEPRPNSQGIFLKIQSLFLRQVPLDTDPAKLNVNILSKIEFEELEEALTRKNDAGDLVYTDRDFICSPRWFKTIKSSSYLQTLAQNANRKILLEKIHQSP